VDFYRIRTRESKDKVELYPDFTVGRSKHLMVRGKAFYAVWDEAAGLWSTDEYDVQRLVDQDLAQEAEKFKQERGVEPSVKYLGSYHSTTWRTFKDYVRSLSDNSHELDSTLVFANTEAKRTDYSSKRLLYALEAGDYSAWDELIGTLYGPEDRAKIEWAIGAILSGDSKKIQKFLVLYGSAGTGKSTILGIIEKLFHGYVAMFDAKALGSQNGTFATEVFRDNPLVAIQHDGDLSRIEDNTRLNSIIAHEPMTMNEKYKASYTARVNAFLFMGTNQPVKISDAKSGIIRRLIDVNPTGVTFNHQHYSTLMAKIEFELGAIAHHCLEVYHGMGKNAYSDYRPVSMMFQTDPFLNYVESNYDIFRAQDGVTLKQAYSLYKEYCEDSSMKALPMYKFRGELQNYFDEYHTRTKINGVEYSSYFQGFTLHRAKKPVAVTPFKLVLEETVSPLDEMLAEMPAQLATVEGFPKKQWVNVSTKLGDLDTHLLHYVKVPENHIVIDFDLRDETGNKSLEMNLNAASSWPSTYAELSKSGQGIHLHYIYDGDPDTLAREYATGIEIKVYKGNASLRRMLTRCNNLPVAPINGGLPTREKPVLEQATMTSERGLRELITRNLKKEIHPGTKPSIDFIRKILDEAYDQGMPYDVSDMRPRIVAFANNSSNHNISCLKEVQKMKFVGRSEVEADKPAEETGDPRLVFYDLEVYPNLFVVCWKFEGDGDVVRMRNPSPQDVEQLFKLKLVGFNNRRYDNHILWARYLGYSNEGLYKLSQKLIDNDRAGSFGEAFNISYTDIYDYSSKKQGLKKFQIELGLPHKEMDLPWDQPVPDDRVDDVIEYCANDVVSSEAVHNARIEDFKARQILADLSGLTVNDTTQKHTAKIIFGGDRNPQKKFVYTDLSTLFPGYVFDKGKSFYRGEDPSEGGYVYAEPGMYENVAVLDVASMHPTSIEELNLFGDYTINFAALKAARMAIKHGDYESAEQMFDGALTPYLQNKEEAKALSYALKIVINIVYGLTSAKFDNPFRDIRNVDNIVAKRGALFMIDLKHFVQELGFQVVHIKTDSIKIPNATDDIIEQVMNFGARYGYEFEHETTYEKFCLVNDAVYVAKYDGKWEAVGAQFQHPYVYKTLFKPDEEIVFDDLCETKNVTKGAMYLDFQSVSKPMCMTDGGMVFVGRTGRFVPVTEESGGGILLRIDGEKQTAVSGTKGYLWLEATVAQPLMLSHDIVVDMTYFDALADAAVSAIKQFGDDQWFIG
jgi:hypothetical protein